MLVLLDAHFGEVKWSLGCGIFSKLFLHQAVYAVLVAGQDIQFRVEPEGKHAQVRVFLGRRGGFVMHTLTAILRGMK